MNRSRNLCLDSRRCRLNRSLRFESLGERAMLAADVGVGTVEVESVSGYTGTLDPAGDSDACASLTPTTESAHAPGSVYFDEASGVIVILGNAGADSVTIERVARTGNIRVVARFESELISDLVQVEVINLPASKVTGILYYGVGGNDTIVNDTSIRLIAYGGDGNDRITGGSDDDFLDGGSGNDVVYAGGGDDTVYARGGNDVVYAGGGDDTVHGGDDNDALVGEDGDDTLCGENGNDIVMGGAGNDTLKGDDGIDFLAGEDGDDSMQGGAGDDLLYGGGGNDDIEGQRGDDHVEGGAGDDTLDGGDDDDVLEGGEGNDRLHGGSGNDDIFGGEGYDFLFGEDGLDYLHGGGDDDVLRGGEDEDFLYGGDGNDLLEGGVYDEAVDVLVGGPGADRFIQYERWVCTRPIDAADFGRIEYRVCGWQAEDEIDSDSSDVIGVRRY